MTKNNSSLKNVQHNGYAPFKKFKLMVFLTGINLSSFMILSFLKIMKPFKFIKLCWIRSDRLGHLAVNHDLFLRRIQLGKTKTEGIFYFGVSYGKVANNQLMKMLKRKLPIIQLPDIKTLNHSIDIIFNMNNAHEEQFKSLFDHRIPFYSISNSTFYQELPCNGRDNYPNEYYYEFNNAKPNLYFTKSEEKKGKKLLRNMGLEENSWFICFHSRDSAYLEREHDYRSGGRWSYHDYRDCDVENYLKAAKYITDCNGYAVRMGFRISKKLPNLNNPQIIDYAAHHRTDFGDIYLPAKCKFFLGNTAGIYMASTIFNLPAATANYVPLGNTPHRKGDLFIPKKIWSIKEKRFLTFREILDSEVGTYFSGDQYRKAGLKVVENTAEEILDLAVEMNERIDGAFKYTKEDEKLQKKFHSLYKPNHACYGTPARIGAKFLRDNKALLK